VSDIFDYNTLFWSRGGEEAPNRFCCQWSDTFNTGGDSSTKEVNGQCLLLTTSLALPEKGDSGMPGFSYSFTFEEARELTELEALQARCAAAEGTDAECSGGDFTETEIYIIVGIIATPFILVITLLILDLTGVI
jgi:hypothetical protein|tara:strand:- start:354 stop:758 length:405 start_codon:yes stop_codon:yes gene_type:complete